MWINNLDPVLLEIGSLEIRYYGLVYAIGFLLAYYYIYKNREKLNLDAEKVTDFVFWLIVGLVVGARVLHFLEFPGQIVDDPLIFFKVWKGGMSFFGGFIGSAIVLYWFSKKHNIDMMQLAEVLMIPGFAALILGRLANFVNGELPGTETSVAWCVVFPLVDDTCRHPYPIYAAISHALLLGIVLAFRKMLKGKLVYLFMAGYGFFRILTDMFRDDVRWMGLTLWQYMAGAMLVVGLFMLLRKKIKDEDLSQSA